MIRTLIAFVSALLLFGTPAVAESWADKFQIVDTDNSGTISRAEWDANGAKVGDPTMNPTLATMDTNNNNSVDQDEWAAAEGMKKAHATSCQESTGSWCPCQNNPEDPACQ